MTVAAQFEIPYLQYLGEDGRIVGNPPPEIANPKALVALFQHMLMIRHFDAKAIALQRTGKLGTYPPCLGHEAAHVGMGAILRPGDIFAPSYREYVTLAMRGVPLHQVLLYWGGDERGSDFPRHSDAARDFPLCVPIATQCLHAAGAAMAMKYRQQTDRFTLVSCGDGGSSKADFYAAINLAGVYQLPLIICIVNNGWAISVPRFAQTGAETLAQKGIAGGLPCMQVDGNDLLAVLDALSQARARALAGQGATVIELITYRLSDHTTADDARRYRTHEELQQAWQREPMIRLRRYLVDCGFWDALHEDRWLAHCTTVIDEEINTYLTTPPQPVSAMFESVYAHLPACLQSQCAAAQVLENTHHE